MVGESRVPAAEPARGHCSSVTLGILTGQALPGQTPHPATPSTVDKLLAANQMSVGQEQRQSKGKVQTKAYKGRRAGQCQKQQLRSVAHAHVYTHVHTPGN